MEEIHTPLRVLRVLFVSPRFDADSFQPPRSEKRHAINT
jgi:hypothetical protein